MTITIAEFQKLIETYQDAHRHTGWVIRNMSDFRFTTPESPEATFNSALDQEKAALRDLLDGARRLLDEATPVSCE